MGKTGSELYLLAGLDTSGVEPLVLATCTTVLLRSDQDSDFLNGWNRISSVNKSNRFKLFMV